VLDGAARADARGGSTVGGENPSSTSLSADLLGRTANPDFAVRFGVTPTLVFAEGRDAFVRAFGEAELPLGRGARARLRQAIGYGSVDRSALAPAVGPGPVQPPAGSRFVAVEELNSALEVEVPASRRLRITGFAAWTVAGGADAEARNLLPLARGPQFRGRFDWLATQLDTLGVELGGHDERFSNAERRRASVATLTAAWRRRFSRGSDILVALGPAVGRSQTGDQPASVAAYAAGSLDVRTTPLRDVSVGIGAAVEPLGDPLTGELVERGSLRASAAWDRHRGVALVSRIIGSMPLTSGSAAPADATSPRAGDLYLEGELSATLPLGERSTVAAGVRAAFVSRPVLNQPDRQWVGFVSYAAQLPLIRERLSP
jgi:hypothetical protein